MSWHFERHAATHQFKKPPHVLAGHVLMTRQAVGSLHEEYVGDPAQSFNIVIKRSLLFCPGRRLRERLRGGQNQFHSTRQPERLQ